MNQSAPINTPKTGEHGFQKTHGLRRSPEYNTWNGMKHRCHNPNYGGYKKYGARGIAVCDRWRESFVAFYGDMGPRPSPKHSLDRIDNLGPYSPENCRWATPIEQMNNQRKTIFLEVDGVKKTLRQIADEAGLPLGTVQQRYHLGYSLDRIVHKGPLTERGARKPSTRPLPPDHRNISPIRTED